MSQQLRDITSDTINTQPIDNQKPHPLLKEEQSIRQIISINGEQQAIDFKQCIPGTVHEKKLAITLKQQQLSAKIINILIICQDQTLNSLPEYIFGVRKESSYEYFDQFRFKAIQKGTYNFIVGVKTPLFNQYLVKAKLFLTVDGLKDIIELELKQQVVVPIVRCCKELVSDDGFRMIKLASIKNKTKKQTKLVFRCTQNINITLLAEFLGIQNEVDSQIEVKPKMTQTGGKGMFLLTVVMNCPQTLNQKQVMRRILALKIKDTSCYFHFPVEVSFYPEGQHKSLAE